MAGESAEEVARRQRAKAERLLASAQRWERGAQGESVTGAVLDGLRAEGWAVFHDVRWPGRPRANLDHVVVGPPGVFVVDSKNWSGRIDVGDNSFRCNGRKQDRTVASAGDAALAVARLVSPPATASVRSVLCFVRDEPVIGWCYDVMLCSTLNLREMLLTRPAVLSPEQVRAAAVELDVAFRGAASSAVRQATRTGPAMHPQSVMRPPAPPRSQRRKKRNGPGALLRLGLLVLLGVVFIGLLPRLSGLADDLGDMFAKSVVPHVGTTYETCKALREDYPHGVGTKAAVHRVRSGAGAPAPAPRVYAANEALDKDRDHLACERGDG